jgi:hypothetical protein
MGHCPTLSQTPNDRGRASENSHVVPVFIVPVVTLGVEVGHRAAHGEAGDGSTGLP